MSHSLRFRLLLILISGALATSGWAQVVFNFTTTAMTVDENGTSYSVTILRTGDTVPSSAVTLTYGPPTTLPAGTTAATGGADYGVSVNSPNTYIFPPDDEVETFTFTIADDDLKEGAEQFEFNLAPAAANASVGNRSRLVVTIKDQESNPGALSFTATKASVVAGKSTNLTVQRVGGTVGAVTVDYAFSNAAFPSGKVSFAEGESSKTITVNAPDGSATSDYNVTATLSNATGGATLGTNTALTLTVKPSDVFSLQTAGFTGLLDLGAGYGNITLKSTSTGNLTGKLSVDGTAYTIKGKLNADGSFSQTFTTKVGGVSTSKKLDLQLGTLAFKGTFDPDANAAGAVRNITGERDAIVAKGASAPHTGYFTLFLGNNALQTTGYTAPGTLSVSKTGSATLKVTLPDGTKASAASKISGTGVVRFSAPLYSKLGFLQGTATGASSGTPDGFDGTSTWTKPAVAKPKAGQLYTGGVAASQATLIADLYTKPASQTIVLTTLAAKAGKGTLTLQGGDLPATITHAVTVSTANKVTIDAPAADKLKLAIVTSTGAFSGSFVDPVDNKSRKIAGYILQGEQEFAGQFPGTTKAGKVLLQAAK